VSETIAEMAAREESLVFGSFDANDAWRLGSAAADIIFEHGYSLAVQVVLAGRTVFKAAFNGVSQDTEVWLVAKAAVALHFGSSSRLVRLRSEIDPTILAGLDEDLYRAHGGAVPIRVKGRGVVGTITVSGEPDTVDHAVAIEALARLLSP
jgi:uncharacterized protein (UPF0303 family)